MGETCFFLIFSLSITSQKRTVSVVTFFLSIKIPPQASEPVGAFLFHFVAFYQNGWADGEFLGLSLHGIAIESVLHIGIQI